MTDIFWLEQRACDVPARDDWLAPCERERLAAFQVPKRRADWRLGRWTAKMTSAAFLGLPSTLDALKAFEIRPAPCGAPEVFRDDCAAPFSISLSHCAGRGLCAVASSDTAPGCDLEILEPRSPNFLQDFFTADEQEAVARARAPERDRLITVFWSAKESVLKSLRIGLRSATTAVSVYPVGARGPQTWNRFFALTDSGQIFNGWWFEAEGLVRTFARPRRRALV